MSFYFNGTQANVTLSGSLITPVAIPSSTQSLVNVKTSKRNSK